MEIYQQPLNTNIKDILNQPNNDMSYNQITVNQDEINQNRQNNQEDYMNQQILQRNLSQLHAGQNQNNQMINNMLMQQQLPQYDNQQQQQQQQHQQQQYNNQQQQMYDNQLQQQQQQLLQQQLIQQQLMQQQLRQSTNPNYDQQHVQPPNSGVPILPTDNSPPDSNSSYDKLVNELKGPIILFILCFILNTQQFMDIIKNYLPKFGVDENGKNTIMGVSFKALLLVVLFASINKFILKN